MVKLGSNVLPPSIIGSFPIAIFKHRPQSSADKSSVHCPKVYNFCELVTFAILVLNFTLLFTISVLKSFMVLLSTLENVLVSLVLIFTGFQATSLGKSSI